MAFAVSFLQKRRRRALNLLQHPRFRAAYDFMALRALAGDENMELAHGGLLSKK